MRLVADSSLLVRLYLHDNNTDAIERFLVKDAKVLSVSELARVEVLNVLLRREQRAAQFLNDLRWHCDLEASFFSQKFS